MKFYIGIDVGGTKIAYGLFDEARKLLVRKQTASDDQKEGQEFFEPVLEIIRGFMEETGNRGGTVEGIGIGITGFVDFEKGALTKTASLPKLNNFAVVDYLKSGELPLRCTHNDTKLNNVKNNLFVPNCIPDLAVVDPDWAMTMPPKLTASCGFDVFSHAIETISSSRWNPMSETIALKCIDIVWTYLERAYHNGSDVEAREYMHFASSAVAVAFSDSLINLGHEIAHMIGARYHIPHGDCCAMVTPACLKFLAGKLPVEMGRIAKTLGVDDREDGLGDRLYDAVLAFRKRLGIMSASEHGLDKAEFMAMADDLASPVFLSYTMTADDYRSILADIISE